MKTVWRIAGVVAMFAVGGCGRFQDVPLEPAHPLARQLELVHDFGQVIEGTKIEHVFSITNAFPVPIAIADDVDIRKTCGCTTLKPSTWRLQPGETATVNVQINTVGKIGRFRVGGLIRWRTGDGRYWPVNIYVDGTAKTILATEPGLVQFSAADVVGQEIKEVKVLNSLPVDWSTLRVHIDPPFAEVVSKEVFADHLTLLLRPRPPSASLDFCSTVQIDVDLITPKSGVTHCAVAVAVQGTQQVDVQVAPRTVFASWSPDVKKATARFLVRGLTSDVPQSVSSISCNGFRAAWVTKEISPQEATTYRTLQIELSLSDPDNPAIDLTQARRVEIVLSNGRSLEVPVYFVAQERS